MGLSQILNRNPTRLKQLLLILNPTQHLLNLSLLTNQTPHFPPFLNPPFRANSTNADDPSNPDDAQTQKKAEEICKLISTHPSNPLPLTALSTLTAETQLSPSLVLAVLKKLTNAGVLALSFFRWAETQSGFKHTPETYNALVDALGKIKQFSLIWVLVETMKKKGVLTKDCFMLIVRRYARAKKIKEAVVAFERMESFGLKPDLSDFNRFIDTLCKSRQVGKAQEVFDEMPKRGFVCDNKSYSILLQGWGQEQDLVRLKEVYGRMEREGIPADGVTYGIVVNAYCKAGKFDEAVGVFREMGVKGCEASAPVYCTLIHGLGSANRLGEALKFFEMSKASGVGTEAPTYNAVVGSYCWSLKFDDAFKMVDEMRRCGVGPNSRTYDIILHHLVKAQRESEACDVFRRMRKEQGCQPTLSTYEIMLRMFCNQGKVGKAVRVWGQMKAQGILPSMHMFSTLISRLCHEKKLEDACKYFEEMLDVGIRPPGPLFSNLKQTLIAGGKKDTFVSLSQKLGKIRATPIEMVKPTKKD